MSRDSAAPPRRLVLLAASLLAAAALALAIQHATGVETPGEERFSIRMKPVADSGVSGKARFESRGTVTLVRVRATGPSDAGYVFSLRRGSCTAYAGLPDAPLGLASSSAAVETAVDLEIAEVRDGGWVVTVHDAAGDLVNLVDPARAVACGVIPAPPAAESEPAIASAPTTGIGTNLEHHGGRFMSALAAVGVAFVALGVWTRHSVFGSSRERG